MLKISKRVNRRHRRIYDKYSNNINSNRKSLIEEEITPHAILDDGSLNEYNNIYDWQRDQLKNSGWYAHGLIDDTGEIYELHTHGLDDLYNEEYSGNFKHNPKYYEFRINWIDNNNYDDAGFLISLLADHVMAGRRFYNNNYFEFKDNMYILRLGYDNPVHGDRNILDIIWLGMKSDSEVRNIVTLLQTADPFLINSEIVRIEI